MEVYLIIMHYVYHIMLPPHPQVQFALWLMRYIGTGLLFFIGLKAPGLPRRPYMLLINEDERDVENGQVL